MQGKKFKRRGERYFLCDWRLRSSHHSSNWYLTGSWEPRGAAKDVQICPCCSSKLQFIKQWACAMQLNMEHPNRFSPIRNAWPRGQSIHWCGIDSLPPPSPLIMDWAPHLKRTQSQWTEKKSSNYACGFYGKKSSWFHDQYEQELTVGSNDTLVSRGSSSRWLVK